MTQKEIAEIAEFISGVRESEDKSWWVGIFDADTESPKLVSTSLRGFFQESFWKPVKDEHAGPCCDIVHEAIKKDEENPFLWMEHCVDPEHIKGMLKNRTDKQLDAEYQYMLEQIMTSLTDSF